MTVEIDILGTDYEVPSDASSTNWVAMQVLFEQALAAGINEVNTDLVELTADVAALDDVVWAPLTLVNSWANIAGNAPAASYLDPFRVAHVRMAIDTGGDATSATTLPVGQRPPYPLRFIANGDSADDLAIISIATSGVVTITGSNSYNTTNGIYLECSFSVVANP